MVAYCSREDVAASMDVRATAYQSARLDRVIESASREVEKLCGERKFLPMLGTRTLNPHPDDPDRIYMGEHDLLSVTSITDEDGTAIASTAYDLMPAHAAQVGRPYRWIDFDSAPGDNVAIVGRWGYQNVTRLASTLALAVNDSITTVNFTNGHLLGVGNLYLLDSEYVEVTARTFITTAVTLATDLTAQAASNSLTCAGVIAGEVLMVDAEKMLALDVAGSTVVVQRAYDGSTLAAHTTGATIYAARSATVTRAARGSTAAAHTTTPSTTIYWVEPPAEIRRLTIALAVDALMQEGAGYARTAGSGDSERETRTPALIALRDEVVAMFGYIHLEATDG